MGKRNLRIPLDMRKKRLLKKRSCFSCFSVTHLSKLWRVKNSRLYCAKPHHYLMYDHPKESGKPGGIESNSLSNSCINHNVFLISLIAKVKMNNRVETFRALIDRGSQYSYISKHAIEKLGIKSNKEIKMQHRLFGGEKRRVRGTMFKN
ncbi:DUF1758 domain-containing protein [Nephila pilipes]|uniref:DUF1758 domain-containing protein n=1 Tax=Nephila pilipes TaxID=299642 RepID=A0A8X6QPN4_NEPPI|nr:DUF1758 domain-containing protein [Nephila pilipes]